MNSKEIIEKKLNNQPLSKEEIKYMVMGYVEGTIDEETEMIPFIRAIYDNGMTEQETIDLTEIMLHSGDIIDLSDIKGIKVDKHSTGGIGDKTTIILAPLVASCGVIVPKMSGRSLGHTGGTIDKLESISGFNVALSKEQFANQINNINVVIASQTGNLVPADKKIYNLRDRIGTVDSIPLIASSIMSKKLASGADKIVIDLKVGDDAFMRDLRSAKELGQLMVKIGKAHGKETICVLTDMSQPLGYAIGNALEVRECIDVLSGQGPEDLKELVITLGSLMVSLAKDIPYSEAEIEVKTNLENGNALEKFKELVKWQNGEYENIPVSQRKISIKSPVTGFINEINATKLGNLSRKLGLRRFNIDDMIDYTVGFVLEKKIGDYVMKDETLVTVYLNNVDLSINEIIDCFTFTETTTNRKPLIYTIIK